MTRKRPGSRAHARLRTYVRVCVCVYTHIHIIYRHSYRHTYTHIDRPWYGISRPIISVLSGTGHRGSWLRSNIDSSSLSVRLHTLHSGRPTSRPTFFSSLSLLPQPTSFLPFDDASVRFSKVLSPGRAKITPVRQGRTVRFRWVLPRPSSACFLRFSPRCPFFSLPSLVYFCPFLARRAPRV